MLPLLLQLFQFLLCPFDTLFPQHLFCFFSCFPFSFQLLLLHCKLKNLLLLKLLLLFKLLLQLHSLFLIFGNLLQLLPLNLLFLRLLHHHQRLVPLILIFLLLQLLSLSQNLLPLSFILISNLFQPFLLLLHLLRQPHQPLPLSSIFRHLLLPPHLILLPLELLPLEPRYLLLGLLASQPLDLNSPVLGLDVFFAETGNLNFSLLTSSALCNQFLLVEACDLLVEYLTDMATGLLINQFSGDEGRQSQIGRCLLRR